MVFLIAGILMRIGLPAVVAKIFATGIIYATIAGIAYLGWNAFIANPYREEGRAEIRALWDKAIQNERDRVAEAVAEALATARLKIAALEKREGELNDELIALALAAANDAAADDVGLGVDSVRSLNRIR